MVAPTIKQVGQTTTAQLLANADVQFINNENRRAKKSWICLWIAVFSDALKKAFSLVGPAGIEPATKGL